MVNSKAKGGEFERKISKLLTKISGYKWWRTKGSGNTKAESKADIKPVDRKSEIFVECKNVKTIKFKDILLCTQSLHNIIEKVEKESKGKPWAIFINIHREGIYMLTSESALPNWWYKSFLIVAAIIPINGNPYQVWLHY